MAKYVKLEKLVKHDWGKLDENGKIVGVVLHIYSPSYPDTLSINCEDFEQFYFDPAPVPKYILCVMRVGMKQRLVRLEEFKIIYDQAAVMMMGEYKLINWYDVDGGRPVELPIETPKQPSIFNKLNSLQQFESASRR